MGKLGTGLAFALPMIITVVVVDLLFFKNHTGPRLAVNIGIVLVYAGFYLRFAKRS